MTKNNLQKNIAMKDSGVEWIGKIPKGWEVINFKKLLDYVQPGKYITDAIQKTKFDDDATPVLTANKGFVIGYTDEKDGVFNVGLPVIIFDDFTTNRKFVDFPFKVRSSALKILISRLNNNADIRFIFRNMEVLGFHVLEHNRHWISIYSKEYITFPNVDIQKRIADFLDEKTGRVDDVIEKKKKLIELLKEKITSLAIKEQNNGRGDFMRIRHLVTLVKRKVTISHSDEYIALGLYNRGRGLFHKLKKLGIDMGDSDFFYIKEGDLILSGQFAWEGAVAIAGITENNCVVSHRYPVLRGKSIETEYLLALLMTNFGDFLLNETSRGAAGRNRPLNINLLLSEKIRVPSIEVQNEIKKLIHQKKDLEGKIEKQITLLKEYRASLIYHAVTGKIAI